MQEPDIKVRRVTQKARFRMQQVAKMTAQGIPDSEIAILLGYSDIAAVRYLRTSTEFKLIAQGLFNKVTTEIDLQAAETTKELKNEIKHHLPEALRVLYDALADKKAETRLKAADKLIELDGRLGKKNTEGSVNQFFFSETDANIGDSIAAALGKD